MKIASSKNERTIKTEEREESRRERESIPSVESANEYSPTVCRERESTDRTDSQSHTVCSIQHTAQ